MNRAAALILACACLAPSAHAGERKLTEKQVPAAVLAAFRKAYPAASIRGLAKETGHGRTTFEIESEDGQVRRDLSYLGDGTLAEIEETVSANDLPAPVAAALDTKFHGAKVVKAEKDTRGGVITYELRISEGHHAREVVFAVDGKVLDGGSPTGH